MTGRVITAALVVFSSVMLGCVPCDDNLPTCDGLVVSIPYDASTATAVRIAVDVGGTIVNISLCDDGECEMPGDEFGPLEISWGTKDTDPVRGVVQVYDDGFWVTMTDVRSAIKMTHLSP